MAERAESKNGWIFLDDDGWEHDPNPQHPHERGEAQYATDFRRATKREAKSKRFFRAVEVHHSLATGETTVRQR
jgi:hypothetical protein